MMKKHDNSFDVDIDIESGNGDNNYDPATEDFIQDVAEGFGNSFDGYDKKSAKSRKKGLIAGALAFLIAGAGVSTGVNEFSKVEVPDVYGLSANVAERQLETIGYEPDEIIIECDGVLTADEIKHGEYEVISQDPPKGEKTHTSDTIHLICQDNKKIRIDEMTSCRYEKASDALSLANKYKYKYELNDIDGNDITAEYEALDAFDQEKYYVFEQTAFNDNKRIAEYTIDTEENIENKIEKQFKKLKGDSVSEADKLAESFDFTVSYQAEDKNTVTNDYVITGFSSVDLTNRTASMKADSKEHIKEVKLLKKIAKKIPYEGLDEKYLAKTSIGDYDREEDDYDNYDLGEDETAYYWTSDDGKYDVLEIICEDGKVTKVNKLNKEVYWASAKPDFSADKDAYDERIAAEAAAAAAAEREEEEARQETQGVMVWIPRTGSCYHSNQFCSNMKNPSKVTLSEAESWGYRACKRCH